MNPKYSEGELVILQSTSAAHLNGEYTVRNVIKWGDTYRCRLTEQLIRCVPVTKEAYSYTLEECHVKVVSRNGDLVENVWKESALRKKHEPGEFSYQELIESINSVVLV